MLNGGTLRSLWGRVEVGRPMGVNLESLGPDGLAQGAAEVRLDPLSFRRDGEPGSSPACAREVPERAGETGGLARAVARVLETPACASLNGSLVCVRYTGSGSRVPAL